MVRLHFEQFTLLPSQFLLIASLLLKRFHFLRLLTESPDRENAGNDRSGKKSPARNVAPVWEGHPPSLWEPCGRWLSTRVIMPVFFLVASESW